MALAVLVAALASTLASSFVALHSQWTDVAAYSHGYLLVPVGAWLTWRFWRARPPAVLRPDWAWLVPFCAALAVLWVLELLLLNVPRVFVLPVLVLASIGLVFGRSAARHIMWPMLLLYGALPIWPVLNHLLQAATTAAVSFALALTGVPVFIEGNFVHLPAGTFEIAEGCAGLRYLIIATTLGLIAALAFLETWPRRFMLLAAAVAGAVLGNWLRVYVIVVVGHLSDMQSALVADHVTFGWILFSLAMVPALWSVRILGARGVPRVPVAERATAVRGRGIVAAAIGAAMLLGVMRLGVALTDRIGDVPEYELPMILDVEPVAVEVLRWRPRFVDAVEIAASSSGDAVEIYVAAYPRQDRESRLIAYANGFEPEGWRAVAETQRVVAAGTFAPRVIELEGYLDGGRRVIWAWYCVAGKRATGVVQAKLHELEGLFEGRRDATAVAVSTACDPDSCDTARERLARWSAILAISSD